MPELPEVEVTRRLLAPLMLGRRVAAVRTTRPSYFFLTPPATLRRRLRERRFESLERVGKYMLASLDDGQRLLLHLGMTGQLFGDGTASPRLLSSTARASLRPEGQLAAFRPDAHTHLRLHFDDGGPQVLFRDVRKFGKVALLGPGESCERVDRLGPDALRASGDWLLARSRGRRLALKAFLLDQSVIAGVGNIYADEALFAARLAPSRAASRLTREQSRRLAQCVRRVLRRGIVTGGSSISDYVHPDGADGGYQDERFVYGRTGEPCLVCGTPIRRRVIAQRSTHHCPRCQR